MAAAVRACAKALRAGGVAAVPTETVYGLVTLWDNAAGRQRIYELKRRPADKRLQMLAADLAMAQRAGVLPDPRLEKFAAKFWPGPLTVVCAAQSEIENRKSEICPDTIGLRIPDHPFMHALLQELGAPLAATSANLSGEPPGADADSAVARLDGQPDLVVDGGPIAEAAPSTVAAITGGELKILRPGTITESELRNALTDGAAAAPRISQ
jgi:L-threonylcarbamoyladenylate synthase